MRICICGAGTMGSGIAQVTASAGYDTVLYDVSVQTVDNARLKLEKDLQLLVDKGKLDIKRKSEILERLQFTSTVTECIADIIIEAVIEKLEVKVELFTQLASINQANTILATNTSSLSITDIASSIVNPGRVAGLHFFNPAPLMKLVEVVRGAETSPDIVGTLTDFTKRLGKVPVVCKDAPGFIVNRVARPYYIEALRLAEEGLADFATIDRVMENQGFRMGPFRLMDLIGNDINYAVSCSVYEQLGKPERLRPSYIQKEKVEKGELGKKTKKGYYEY